MGKKQIGVGKLPKRPTGPMSEPSAGAGLTRAHMFDVPLGQPKRRKENTPGV